MRIKIVLLMMSLGMGILTQAQNTIKGSLKEPDGKKITDIQVYVSDLNRSEKVNSDGTFILNDIPDGGHEIVIESSFYEPIIDSIEVKNGQTKQLQYNLVKTMQLDEVIIIGSLNPKMSISTSLSLSSIKAEEIEKTAAKSIAEIIRTIPGIRAEFSGADGNSNISVRGIPISVGGSRYLLIQEDGLPALQFGDITYGTQDQFLRFDNTISKIEGLRGGSSSILSSNSPAGAINLISKTGEKKGGSISTSVGLNYNTFRTDMEYGMPFGDGYSFHVGGFYRIGDGPRETGYTSYNGGQFKVSLSKKFNNGNFRIYTKYLNDRVPSIMATPMIAKGTNDDVTFENIGSFDAKSNTNYTSNLSENSTVRDGGIIEKSKVKDGMRSLSYVFGGELNLQFKNNWKLENKTRISWNKGQFISPFIYSLNTGYQMFNSSTINNFGGAYYAGTNQTIDPNGIYTKINLYDNKLNNLNNFANNLNISKKWKNSIFNVGVYKALQKIDMDWYANTYFQEVSGNDARLIDIKDISGNLLTTNGLLAYGVPDRANYITRNYNTKYDITAGYFQFETEPIKNLHIDGGLRYDYGMVKGSFKGGNSVTAAIDMNQNGTIESNENQVSYIDNNVTDVDYTYDYLSYSIGVNYKLNNHHAVFARMSEGSTAGADRVLFSTYNYTDTHNPIEDAEARQIEVGYKLRMKKFTFNTTLFHARTSETNYEATTEKNFKNIYVTYGAEIDADYKFSKKFNVKGTLTYTHGEVTESLNKDFVGNIPRRLPTWMYSITPAYNNKFLSTGFTLYGVTQSYAQDSNQMKLKGYFIVNPFVSFNLMKKLNITLNASNIFNTQAITETEEAAIQDNTTNYVRARALPGATYNLGLTLSF